MNKKWNIGRFGVLVATFCSMGFTPLRATSFYWDANGDTAGTGGAGTWDTTSSLWRNGSSTGALEAWPNADPGNGDKAVLGGTAGTLALNSASQTINVNGINFGANYTIGAPSSGTAVLNLSGSTPTIEGSATATRINAVITGGSLTKTSSGKLALMGKNTYTGGTYHTMGQLIVGHTNALGTGTLYLNGGSLGAYTGFVGVPTNSIVMNGNVSFGNYSGLPGDSGYGNALTLAGPVLLSGSRLITVNILGLALTGAISDGSGGYRLTFTGGAYDSALTLGGVNTFSGGLTYNGTATSTLRLGNMGALGTGTFTIASAGKFDNTSGADGTLTYNVPQTWNADFTFTATRSLNMGSGAVSLGTAAGTNRTLTVTTAAKVLTIGGIISNGTTVKALTKYGAGTLAFAGANTYTGGTTVTNGTVSVELGGTLGNGWVTVIPPGKVVLKHGDAIAGDVAVTLNRAGSSYGKMDLAPGVVERVGSVVLDGVTYSTAGTTFGAVGTGSTVESNSFFLGTGQLKITMPPPSTILIR